MGGCGPNEVQSAATIAAPVGVTSSFWTPLEYVGFPCNNFAVAGAGTGKTPCAIFAVPPPTFRGEQANCSIAESFKSDAGADDVHDGVDCANFVK